MSQSFTDSVFQTSAIVSTNIASANVNFAALKSAFSGVSAPNNMLPGQWWFDTTNNILKLRNEANNGWQSVWDFANNCSVISGLAAAPDASKISLAMMNAASKSSTLAPGTSGLRAIGTTAYTACAGNDSRLINAHDLYVDAEAGDNIIGRHDDATSTSEQTYKSIKAFTILQDGEYGIEFDLKVNARTGYACIYRNSVAVGSVQSTSSTSYSTKRQDIGSWAKGDHCLLKMYINGSSAAVYVKNFRLCVLTPMLGVPQAPV